MAGRVIVRRGKGKYSHDLVSATPPKEMCGWLVGWCECWILRWERSSVRFFSGGGGSKVALRRQQPQCLLVYVCEIVLGIDDLGICSNGGYRTCRGRGL